MNVPYLGMAAREIGISIGKFLWEEMNRRGWYPGIYQVNDHGNVTQYSVAGTVLNSWV